MRIQYALCACLLMTGCAKLSDLTHQTAKSEEKAPVTEKSTKKKSVISCKNDSQQEVTFEAKGDEIRKMTQSFSISYTDLGITDDMNSEQIQAKINSSLDEKYNSIDGVHVTTTLKDDAVEVMVEINFEDANIDTLIEKGLLDKGEIQSTYVSLKKSQKDYKANGYACISQ